MFSYVFMISLDSEAQRRVYCLDDFGHREIRLRGTKPSRLF